MNEDERAERIRQDLALLASMEWCKTAATVEKFSRPWRGAVGYVCHFGAGASQLYADGTVEFCPFVLDESDETS